MKSPSRRAVHDEGCPRNFDWPEQLSAYGLEARARQVRMMNQRTGAFYVKFSQWGPKVVKAMFWLAGRVTEHQD